MSMSNRLSKQHFWEWFKRHNKEYLQLHKKSKKEDNYLTNELKAHLRAHGRYMKFSLVWEIEGNAGILTITSVGKSRFFDRIEEFVAKAPEIPNWTIQALEPPTKADFLIEERFGYTGIDVAELRFVKGEEDNNIFVVYHPLYTQKEDKKFTEIATAVTYNVLGERLFGLNFDCVEVDNLSRVPKKSQLLCLEELPALLDNGYSSLMVDGEGNIKESKK